jgi:hypothetical protein
MKIRIVLFFVSAALALGVHLFLFEMRYMWYVEPDDYRLLRGVYIACAGTVIALWAMFPSRILVALVALIALFFPHLYYDSGSRPLLGREIDLLMISVALFSAMLLVGVTQIRRSMKGRKAQS